MTRHAEPSFETACQWWTDLSDIWTPVGWKDHLFQFNVLFNGTILAQPNLNRRTQQWRRQGAQFTFVPSATGIVSGGWPVYVTRDDGMVRQGWNDSAAPVLWSEWSQDGLLLRQEVFAHIPGAQDVSTGIEPLFAWVRLSIHYACRALPLEEKHGFLVKINAPHISTCIDAKDNLRFVSETSAYPRRLSSETEACIPERGYRILEEEGTVRLAIAPGHNYTAKFAPGKPAELDLARMDSVDDLALSTALTVKGPTEKDYLLYIQMDAVEGAHVDLLLPMLSTDRAVFDRELALGYDRALEEANRYWSNTPATAARVTTPEQPINQTIKSSLKLAEVMAEKNPADGNYALLTGSLTYANLWATPYAMTSVMLLDTLGYHAAAAKYLEVFKREQGTATPPGESFKPHPGYLGTPRALTLIDWLADHGAILYAASQHALLSGDPEFITAWTDPIVKACEFIKDARAATGHGGAEGIMPPAVATDNQTRIQAVWNDGWMYKGLTTAVRLLERTGHPRAGEFAAEARAYQEAFVRAMHEKCARLPRWTDAEGRQHHWVPTAMSGEQPGETRHAFYLDAGPLFLVFAGLMNAEDELMQLVLAWFREGPQTRLFREDGNWRQVPCLRHEMSSCEPCYSWNTFHSHQSGDRRRFLEGMYSLFAGGISRKTFVSCETRGGITGTVFSATLAIYLARLSVVDDQIETNALHLLRLTPLAWLQSDQETIFENVPTEFGPVTLRFALSPDRKTLQVSFGAALRGTPKRVVLPPAPLEFYHQGHAALRGTPKRVVLHVPPVEGLTTLLLNGKRLDWNGTDRSLDIL
ncbi:MAG: hypothetical protein HY320_06635 [Armatimonadetes bacterium]|nr:hypothetical protein [Armatimonadota bacterium]